MGFTKLEELFKEKEKFVRDEPYFQANQSGKRYTDNNEPAPDNIVKSTYRRYPNMHKLYDSFSETFNIPKKNFILTNGTDAALKICIEAIRYISEKYHVVDNWYTDSKFSYCGPTWGMVDVIAHQYFKNIDQYEYVYNEKKRAIEPQMMVYNLDIDNVVVRYSTDEMNNLFSHGDDYGYKLGLNCHIKDGYDVVSFYQPSPTVELNFSYNPIYGPMVFNILDEVYTNKQLAEDKSSVFLGSSFYRSFIIGSFSKCYGCGLRLGYILFNEDYAPIFNLFREAYIANPEVYRIFENDRRKEILLDKVKKNYEVSKEAAKYRLNTRDRDLIYAYRNINIKDEQLVYTKLTDSLNYSSYIIPQTEVSVLGLENETPEYYELYTGLAGANKMATIVAKEYSKEEGYNPEKKIYTVVRCGKEIKQ